MHIQHHIQKLTFVDEFIFRVKCCFLWSSIMTVSISFSGGGDIVIDAKAIAMQVAANIAQRYTIRNADN